MLLQNLGYCNGGAPYPWVQIKYQRTYKQIQKTFESDGF